MEFELARRSAPFSVRVWSTSGTRSMPKVITHSTASSKLSQKCQNPRTCVPSWGWLLNYYGRFIPNLSLLIHPLNALLQKHTHWSWTSSKCKAAFQEAKNRLVSSQILVHYDSNLPILLAGDASAYGVGVVISHVTSDGRERSITFASWVLSSSDWNYPQIEKEALSLIYGVKKFNSYLYGRKFTLEMDHKPLTTILGSKKGIPAMAAATLQRWVIQLGEYDYEIKF